MSVVAIVISLLGFVLLTLGTAVFVAAEFSLTALERSTVDANARTGGPRDRMVQRAHRTLSFQLSGAQIGISITTLITGYLAEPVIARLLAPVISAIGIPESWVEGIALILALLIATSVSMVFGELVAQYLAVAVPLQTARIVAGPQVLFSALFTPLIRLTNGTANRVLRRFGIEPADELSSARSPQELVSLVRTSAKQGALDEQTAKLVDRSLQFGGRSAEEFMTPRSKIEALEAEETVADLLDKVRSTGHSRFPVTRGDLDETIGVVHLKQVFDIPPAERGQTRLAQLALPVPVVPSTLDGDALMEQILGTALQTALVADEYSGIAGMVTVEDLIEEIVGDIRDEHDATTPEITKIAGGHRVSGLLRVDEVADETGFRAPEGDYETIGGVVMHALGRIPVEGDTVDLVGFDPDASPDTPPRWRATVARMDGRRVDLLDLVRLADPDENAEDGAAGDGGAVLMGDLLAVFLTVLLIAANAFFVAAEFAIISARRDRLEALAEQGKRSAVTVIRAGEQLSLMLAGAQLGITVGSIVLGRVGEPAVAHLLEPVFRLLGVPDAVTHTVSFVVALTTVVILHVLLGEMVPKNIALAGPEKVAMLLVPPYLLWVKATRPVIAIYDWCARMVVRAMGIEPKTELENTVSMVELAEMIAESRSEGLLDPEEHMRLSRALQIRNRVVVEVAVPLAEIRSVRAAAPGAGPTVEAVEEALAETGYSRFPVVDAAGRFTGFVHIKDVLDVLDDPRAVVSGAKVRYLPRIPATTMLPDALSRLRQAKSHLALVTAADGAVAGMVTLEVLVEDLIGTVRDSTHRG